MERLLGIDELLVQEQPFGLFLDGGPDLRPERLDGRETVGSSTRIPR
jgi:hypothetical protein